MSHCCISCQVTSVPLTVFWGHFLWFWPWSPFSRSQTTIPHFNCSSFYWYVWIVSLKNHNYTLMTGLTNIFESCCFILENFAFILLSFHIYTYIYIRYMRLFYQTLPIILIFSPSHQTYSSQVTLHFSMSVAVIHTCNNKINKTTIKCLNNKNTWLTSKLCLFSSLYVFKQWAFRGDF